MQRNRFGVQRVFTVQMIQPQPNYVLKISIVLKERSLRIFTIIIFLSFSLKCGTVLAYCTEGTDEVTKYGIIVFFILFMIIPILLFKWKDSSDRIRYLKHKFQIEQINRKSSLNVTQSQPALKRLDRTFDIYFENLSLTLPSGVTIMQGVTGHLKSGRTTAVC